MLSAAKKRVPTCDQRLAEAIDTSAWETTTWGSAMRRQPKLARGAWPMRRSHSVGPAPFPRTADPPKPRHAWVDPPTLHIVKPPNGSLPTTSREKETQEDETPRRAAQQAGEQEGARERTDRSRSEKWQTRTDESKGVQASQPRASMQALASSGACAGACRRAQRRPVGQRTALPSWGGDGTMPARAL